MNYIFSSALLVAAVVAVSIVEGFQQMHISSSQRVGVTTLSFFGNDNKNDEPPEREVEGETKKKGIFDLKAMMVSFDAVVDDFVYKRMGNGEQFYGKRKYNPSGTFEGDYNGMGQSDLIQIEIARAKREAIEERRQARLEDQASRGVGRGPEKWR